MRLRFISHASFSVESQGTTLITDPWLRGKAFNQGWALLSPAAEVSWPDIDYVWISHQHPDHLNFPTLKSVDPQHRSVPTMLYQKHASLRISKVIKGLGYANFRELTLNKWAQLGNGMEVICGSVGSMDSWIAIRAEGVTILNLNDCSVSPGHLAHISKLVGKVTVLLTQFSFANWIGNHADETGNVEKKLREIQFRVTYLKPEFTIPFASFVYFCNQENSWMNEFSITPRRVVELGLPGLNFMYPGDEWDSNVRTFRSAEAVDKYMADIAHPKVIDPTPAPVDPKSVEDNANRMLRTLRSRFGKFLIGRIPPFTVYLHDLHKVLEVNPGGISKISDATGQSRQEARLVMCSQVAWYAFAYPWGLDAMQVSGMYLAPRWREPFPLQFYFNALSTEFLEFGELRQSTRTLQFMWAKRHELTSRLRARLSRARAR